LEHKRKISSYIHFKNKIEINIDSDGLNNDIWPVAKFYFLVSIKGKHYEGEIGFQEVSGLDQETDIMEYRHGDSPSFGTIKKPG